MTTDTLTQVAPTRDYDNTVFAQRPDERAGWSAVVGENDYPFAYQWITEGVKRVQSKSASANETDTVSVTLDNAPTLGNLLIAIVTSRGSSGTVLTPVSSSTPTSLTQLAAAIEAGLLGYSIFAGVVTDIATAWGYLHEDPDGDLALTVIEYSGFPDDLDVSRLYGGLNSATGTGTTATAPLPTVTREGFLLQLAVIANHQTATQTNPTEAFRRVTNVASSGAPAQRTTVSERVLTSVPAGMATPQTTLSASKPWLGLTAAFIVQPRRFSTDDDGTIRGTNLAVDDVDTTTLETASLELAGVSIRPHAAEGWDGVGNVVSQTVPRSIAEAADSALLLSGRLSLAAIFIRPGELLTGAGFWSGATPAGVPTHWWFALYDANLALLRQTADMTSTAWAANTLKTVQWTSPYTTPLGGSSRFYIGLVVVASTVPTLRSGKTISATTLHASDPLFGISSTGRTTTAPNPAAAITPGLILPYGVVY